MLFLSYNLKYPFFHNLICCFQVIEIANDAGIKGSSQPYDPFNFDEFNAVEYGGFGAGGGGGGGGGGGNYGGGRGGMGEL